MAGSNECVLKHCPSRYGVTKEKINLFRFPKDIERCKEWATACGQLRLFECKMSCGESLYNSYYRVCSLHFECSMFAGVRKKRLHIDAVPTLFLDKNQPDSEPLNRPTGSCSTQKEDSILRKYMLMDVIKMESEVDPLAVQPCDDAIKEEANPSPDEGNMLDLQVTRIKEECVDESYEDINPEIKFEDLPMVKCEAEEDLCDSDTVKDELDLEVAAEENTILPDGFANSRDDNSVSSEYEGFAHEEHVTIDQDASHSVSSAKFLSTHGDTERFECDICGTYFSKFDILKRHILMHMVERPFRCRICGKFFRKKCDLKRHERQHTEKAFECKFCGKWFSYFGNLKGHKCQNSDEKPFKCNVCGKCFRKKCDLKRHERQHTGEKPFECKFCGKFFSYSGNLKSHERKHTGEKAFKCDDCGKCFWKSCELKRHERRHTGEKPFSCNLCGKSFSCRSSIRSHKLQHAGEKPFKCDICGESFLYRVTIMRHILQHTGEKAFKCDVCGKSFFDNGHLKVHLRKHTGEKPFVCNVCGKCFSHSKNLKEHERKHTG